MCARCSSLIEVVQNLEEINAKLEEDNQGLERDLRNWRAKYTRTCNELERERGEEAQGRLVEQIIQHWKVATGHPGAQVSQVGKRAEYVRKALHFGYSAEQLKKVCDVVGRYPYVDPKRSKHPSGRCQTGEILRDGIETIFKSEVTIDRLLDLADQPFAPGGNEEGEEVSFTTAEKIRAANYPLARVLAALWEIDGPLETPDADTWTTRCPVHFGEGLRAHRSADGLMSIECERGCEFWRLIAALGLEPADLFENADYDPDRRSADIPRHAPSHLQEAASLLAARLSGLAQPVAGV